MATRWPRPVAHLTEWRSAAAPIAAIAVFGLAISMSYPLLGLLLERMGASGTAIGLNTTAAALAIVVCAPILPRVMAHIGIGPLIVGAALGLVGIVLAMAAWHDYGWWTGLRVLQGVCATALFFASEYWIVAAAPEGRRGPRVALYTVSLSVTFMLGPVLIAATGIDGALPFLVMAGVLLAGLLPILWGLDTAPRAGAEAPPRPGATLKFFVTDPSVLWAVVLFGFIEFGATGLLPVWGVRAGLTEAEGALVLASFAAGAVVTSLPIGWIADRADRRRLLLVAALVAAAAALAMIAMAPWLPGILLCGLLWGGVAVALYALPLVELGARYSGHRLAEANAAVILGYGTGALLAPAVLGPAMDAVPPHGLLIAAAVPALAYAALALARLRAAPRA
ncbi:MAG: MFS transporter [Pikeienuella sp.]